MKLRKIIGKMAAVLLVVALMLGVVPVSQAASDITVTFRLIGADRDGNYETWIPTSRYTVSKLKAKVGTVLAMAAEEHGLTLTGLNTDYISAITAPEVLGGYRMAEFTTGPYSGWMYTIDGIHPNVGINNKYLSDGQELIFHYVNDYRYEVEDWHGGTQGTEEDWGKWLEVEDSLPTEEQPEPEEPEQEETPDEEEEELSSEAEDLIQAIDELRVSKANKKTRKKLQALEDAFDLLTREQQDQITNLDQLQKLQDTFDELLEEAAEEAEEELEELVETIEEHELTKNQKKEMKQIVQQAQEGLRDAEDTDELSDILSDAEEELQELVGIEEEPETAQPVAPVSFADVSSADWYYEDVSYVVGNGLFTGTTADQFAPELSMTRAMLVTVLYRLEGSPVVAEAASYADVPMGQWYTDAIGWASAHNIVSGYGNGMFGAQDPVTREQIAAILYRYAVSSGEDVSVLYSLAQYADHGAVSAYALPAMQWANASGLIGGRTADTLAPQGTASRAEVAAILHRFAERA